jgi:hypothetical protein
MSTESTLLLIVRVTHASLLALTGFVPGSGQRQQLGVLRRRSGGVLGSSAIWGLPSIGGKAAKASFYEQGTFGAPNMLAER